MYRRRMKAKKHCVRNARSEEDVEREAIREYRKKMLICSCSPPCVYAPPQCPAAKTRSLRELNRMFALLDKKPALSKSPTKLQIMAKFELPWQPRWDEVTLVSAFACPLLELTIAVAPVLSRYLRQQHVELLFDELGHDSTPKSAVLVMEGVEAVPPPVLAGHDQYVVGVDTCDDEELPHQLTQKAVRQVLFIVPFATGATQQAEVQSVIDRVPIGTNVLLCPAPPPPQRVVDPRHLDEYQRLMDGLRREYGKLESISAKAVLQELQELQEVDDDDGFSTRVYWSTVDGLLARRPESWPRMFEELSGEDKERLEAEARKQQQECQEEAETEAPITAPQVQTSLSFQKKNKPKSGSLWVCVKKSLKNLLKRNE